MRRRLFPNVELRAKKNAVNQSHDLHLSTADRSSELTRIRASLNLTQGIADNGSSQEQLNSSFVNLDDLDCQNVKLSRFNEQSKANFKWEKRRYDFKEAFRRQNTSTLQKRRVCYESPDKFTKRSAMVIEGDSAEDSFDDPRRSAKTSARKNRPAVDRV